MSHATFELKPQGSQFGAWHVGTYLTDGKRLLCVVGAIGESVQLEDACTDCVENWRLADATDRLREVRPCPVS